MDDPLLAIHSDVGGDEPFFRLVEKFYEGVLRPAFEELERQVSLRASAFVMPKRPEYSTPSEATLKRPCAPCAQQVLV